MKKTYNKLVRDRIPEIIEQDGKRAAFRYLEEDEVITQLFNKLSEETAELQDAQNVEEVADVIEVLFAIAQRYGHDEQQTLERVHHKRQQRGSFQKGIFLEQVEES
jgi:predicted house-cleaning noncanonical NTP pyrophosphatase (MazG superfamily)